MEYGSSIPHRWQMHRPSWLNTFWCLVHVAALNGMIVPFLRLASPEQASIDSAHKFYSLFQHLADTTGTMSCRNFA